MGITLTTHKMAPRLISELRVADTGAAGHVTTVTVPEGVVGVRLWFQNSGGTVVRGRVGFAGEASTTLTSTTDGDGKLGHHATVIEDYDIPKWANVLHVASSTANAVVLGSWLY